MAGIGQQVSTRAYAAQFAALLLAEVPHPPDDGLVVGRRLPVIALQRRDDHQIDFVDFIQLRIYLRAEAPDPARFNLLGRGRFDLKMLSRKAVGSFQDRGDAGDADHAVLSLRYGNDDFFHLAQIPISIVQYAYFLPESFGLIWGMKKFTIIPILLGLAFCLPVTALLAQQSLDSQKLDQFFEAYIAEGKLAGISARFWHENELLYSKNIGYQNLEEQSPIDDQTIFRLASLTKPVVSVGALMLVEKGKLSLDEPVSAFLPAFADAHVLGSEKALKEPMLIRHLLSHSSGISSELGGDSVLPYFRNTRSGSHSTLGEWVDELAGIPLAVAPGERFIYSYSTDVLGRVIEIVSGESLDVYLKKVLFDPLGMSHTGYRIAPEDMMHFASFYRYDDQKKLQLLQPNSESSYVTGKQPRGNSGLSSTIDDYSKFVLMLLQEGSYGGRRILQPQTVAMMASNQIPQEKLPIAAAGMAFKGLGFGMGVAVSYEPNPLGQEVGSFGWLGASHTLFWVDPKNKIAGLMFTQFAGKPGQCPILFQVNPLFYEAWRKGN